MVGRGGHLRRAFRRSEGPGAAIFFFVTECSAMQVFTRFFAVLSAAALLVVLPACSDSDPAPIDPSVVLGGLRIELSGATLTTVSAAMPTADNAFLAPTLTLDRTPTTAAAATIGVAAAEPFQTILVQPSGSTSYVRVALPAPTQLIGVKVSYAAGATSIATAVTIAVASGTRTSRSATQPFLTIGQ
jgi:hypothetical protein